MESNIGKLRIYKLKARAELFRLQSESLIKEFEKPMADKQRSVIAQQWDCAIQSRYGTQLMLALLKRQEREGRINPRSVRLS